jgi:hypothetical protein
MPSKVDPKTVEEFLAIHDERVAQLKSVLATLSDDDLQVTWQATFERKGAERPVCVAEQISRRYPQRAPA